MGMMELVAVGYFLLGVRVLGMLELMEEKKQVVCCH